MCWAATGDSCYQLHVFGITYERLCKRWRRRSACISVIPRCQRPYKSQKDASVLWTNWLRLLSTPSQCRSNNDHLTWNYWRTCCGRTRVSIALRLNLSRPKENVGDFQMETEGSSHVSGGLVRFRQIPDHKEKARNFTWDWRPRRKHARHNLYFHQSYHRFANAFRD